METIQNIESTHSEAGDQRVNLKTLGDQQLQDFFQSLGEPRFRGRQVYKWLYQKGATSFDRMTDLSRPLRELLARNAVIESAGISNLYTSSDRTIKGLFLLSTGRKVESVLIPDFDEEGYADRLTVCVSSQVGCAMGCSFCATGQMGFQQNLTSGEIFDQVWKMNELAVERFGRRITNIVFMGMGEPLLNYDNVMRSIEYLTHKDGFGLSPKRITVSTVGLARRIRQLADDGARFHLAVSLHAPTDPQRSHIMPVNRAPSTDLTALKDAILYFTRKAGERITYEYCMFHGFNDTDEDARNLARIARWTPSKVNLIMYNPVPGLGFDKTPEKRLNTFIRILVDAGITVTVRRSRGQDIDAACGQLAARDALSVA